MVAYAYRKLNVQRHEIRLCAILPGTFDETLACNLNVVSLNDKPKYESLSYVWGAAVFNKELVVKDSVDSIAQGPRTRNSNNEATAVEQSAPDFILEVTTNFYTAFRYLRKGNQTRVIWADAVCINQNDLNERSSQVGIMGDIYRNAQQCQIWLGTVEEIKNWPDEPMKIDLVTKDSITYFENFLQSQGMLTAPPKLASAGSTTISPDESILGAFEIVRHLLQNGHLYQMPFWSYKQTTSTDTFFVGTWYKCLRTLLSLVSQPWWERVWIVQEAFLSRKAIVNIGRLRIFLSSFFAAASNYAVHFEGCCKVWTALWHGREDIFLPLLLKMRIVKDLGKVIDDNAAGRLVPVALAFVSQERKATDPRDHFYAITGLMKNPFDHSPLGPVPDYRLDPAQLFREQTLSLMQQSSNIHLLDRAIGVGAPNPLGLPSWVCDWSHHRQLGWLSSLYNASKGHKHQFRLTTDSTFIIAGVLVDVISKLGDIVDPDDMNDIAVKVEQWQNLPGKNQSFDIRTVWQKVSGKNQSFDITTVLRASFLDMIMPREGQPRRLTPNDMTLLDEWWQQWIKGRKRHPGPVESPDIWTTHNCFRYQMNRDRVYATRGGRFGVGPRTLCVGDQIFVVQGVEVPLILRMLEGVSTDASSLRLRRDYSYVGRTYLHGCMDGEVVNSKTQWRTLRLH